MSKHRKSRRCRLGVHRRWEYGSNGTEEVRCWTGECVRCGA